MNNSKNIGTGAAIIIVVLIILFIGWIISLFEPKCAMSGCNKEVKKGSRYCYLHAMSEETYGNPDYNAVYEQSKEKAKQSNESSSSYSSSSGSSSSSSSSSNSKSSTATPTPYSSNSSTKKSSSSTYKADTYDEGYDDVYMDGEPDWDRYDEDEDYAKGADDAMDEYEEYGEDW